MEQKEKHTYQAVMITQGDNLTSIFKHTFFGRGSSFVIVNSEGAEKKEFYLV